MVIPADVDYTEITLVKNKDYIPPRKAQITRWPIVINNSDRLNDDILE